MCEKNHRGVDFEQTYGFHHLYFIWNQEILKNTLVAYHGVQEVLDKKLNQNITIETFLNLPTREVPVDIFSLILKV